MKTEREVAQEYASILQAWLDGKTVQLWDAYPTAGWRDIANPNWDFSAWKYRVKPEVNTAELYVYQDVRGIFVSINKMAYMKHIGKIKVAVQDGELIDVKRLLEDTE